MGVIHVLVGAHGVRPLGGQLQHWPTTSVVAIRAPTGAGEPSRRAGGTVIAHAPERANPDSQRANSWFPLMAGRGARSDSRGSEGKSDDGLSIGGRTRVDGRTGCRGRRAIRREQPALRTKRLLSAGTGHAPG